MSVLLGVELSEQESGTQVEGAPETAAVGETTALTTVTPEELEAAGVEVDEPSVVDDDLGGLSFADAVDATIVEF
ncbi:MAG: hypothetical protein ACOYNI_13005, partial [Acidimicrobiia bacterium]